MKIALVVPHIFMHRDILPHVIFSPAALAVQLAEGLHELGAEVTLFSPGPVDTIVSNSTADLSLFEQELAGRGYGYTGLLKKHPATFIALARQVQSELIATAFARANKDEFDIVHIYTNEEDIALPFAQLCAKPVVFTHHDPFNFLIKYKSVFPKYAHLPWISMSLAQRVGMPQGTNWLANIYHGLPANQFNFTPEPAGNYVAFLGRIIEPKGAHLAIQAVREYNKTAAKPLTLKIAGKHYAGHKDAYWQEQILPHLGHGVEYVGFINTIAAKQDFLGNARALLVPSTFDEPFGMVLIEALACGTPVVGLRAGAIPEIIRPARTGALADKTNAVHGLSQGLREALTLNRRDCRDDFEARFTLDRMCREHLTAYQKLKN